MTLSPQPQIISQTEKPGKRVHFTSMIDDYSDNIDWDEIYRAFHNPKKIADRIRSEIGDIDGPLLFCGFPEVASYLSEQYQVIYVDYSPAVVAVSKARYPAIDTIVLSDLAEFLQPHSIKHVVISGRLSAFWQTQESFRKISEALLAYPRALVLIDYFNREAVHPGLHTIFSAQAAQGVWEYKEIKSSGCQQPAIHNVELKVSYCLDSMRFSYLVQRAYFDQASIESWHKSVFENHITSLLPGLLADDPSFSIKMVGE